MAVSVKVWLTHDNIFSLKISKDSSAVDLVSSGVSRMVIRWGTGTNEYVDSDVAGEGDGQPFDWTTEGANGIVNFDFGEQDIPAGIHTCTLVIYDPLHPDGQVWPTNFRINMGAKIV